MAWLRDNWFVVVAVAIGAAAVLIIGLASENSTAIMWAGGAVGVLVGVAIAYNSQSKAVDRRDPNTRREKK
jgi:succinate-acetate transporter protein